jgi:hypothetical protein
LPEAHWRAMEEEDTCIHTYEPVPSCQRHTGGQWRRRIHAYTRMNLSQVARGTLEGNGVWKTSRGFTARNSQKSTYIYIYIYIYIYTYICRKYIYIYM